jgi:hypothetical protein
MPLDYSFEHGIDHCGYDGIAPILCVGGPVTPRDFAERDLSGIRGVSISQSGLPKGTRWDDLNPAFLFQSLPQLEYLRLWFDDPVDLDVVGHQAALQRLEVDCPKVKGALTGEMPLLRTARLRWPEACTAKLEAPALDDLTLLRPRFESLLPVSHLPALRKLHIGYARNLKSLDGIQHLQSIAQLELYNCSRLTDLSSVDPRSSLHRLVIHSCAAFTDAAAALALPALEELRIQGGEGSLRQVRLPKALSARQIRLDVRGVVAVWI